MMSPAIKKLERVKRAHHFLLERRMNGDYKVDLDRLASIIGVHVIYAPMNDGVSGALRYVGEDVFPPSGFIAFINKCRSEPHKRFSLAHELCHYIRHEDHARRGVLDQEVRENNRTTVRGADPLNFDKGYDFVESDSNAAREAEADRFSAELLMPRTGILWLRDRGVHRISDLATSLGVSPAAMQNRLEELRMR